MRLEFGRRIEKLGSARGAMVGACSLLVQEFPGEGALRSALAKDVVLHGREHAAPLRLAQLLEVKTQKLTHVPMFLHILSVRDISLDADSGNIDEDGSFPHSSRGSLQPVEGSEGIIEGRRAEQFGHSLGSSWHGLHGEGLHGPGLHGTLRLQQVG